MPAQPRRVASFVVYKDEPLPTVAPPKSTPFGTRSANTRVAVSTAHDKENLDPLTGLRPLSGEPSGKKRKTNALASKPVPATAKPLAESTSTKKRKLAAGTATKETAKEREKKEKRTGGAKKPLRAARVRKATELPRVEEAEEEVEEKRAEPSYMNMNQITQAEVNAKCYEFTVLPLADLSQAFETGVPPKYTLKTEAKVDDEFDDAVNVAQTKPSTTGAKNEETKPCSTESSKGSFMFSTPERKRIYAAFTFESPSPASRRFADWRESSLPPLPAVNFAVGFSDEP